jgi:protein-S-isoprenylcysteine O-methyltransferase Ste14
MLELIFGIFIFTVTFWTSLQIIDHDNPKNTIGTAAVIGTVMAVFGAMVGPFLVLLPLVCLLQLLVRYYDLGILQSFGVVFVMFALNFGASLIA